MNEKRKKYAYYICGGIAAVGIIATVTLTWLFLGQERRSEEKMEVLRQEVRQDSVQEAMSGSAQEESSAAEKGSGKGEGEEASAGDAPGENPYAGLFLQNPDMAAWLVVDGTVIDYPVMQTMEDENYYLERDFYGNEDKAGCLILDTDSSLYAEGSTNLIIHGHNMKAGTMFGSLDEYQDEEYCEEHRHVELYTEQDRRRYEVMAVFYSQVYYSTDLVFKYYEFFEAEDESRFQYFYDNIKKLSLYDTGVAAGFGDRFLTLSTCSYQAEDGRFVVVCREVEKEEFTNSGRVD